MAKLQVIKKILVPLDGSQNSFRGLDYAIYLARQCRATITGIIVIPYYPTTLLLTPVLYEMELNKATKEFMAKAKKRSAQNGIVFNEKITHGHAVDKILDFARDKKFDLIVISARGLGTVKGIFLGSTSNSVVHKSKIPVMIVK